MQRTWKSSLAILIAVACSLAVVADAGAGHHRRRCGRGCGGGGGCGGYAGGGCGGYGGYGGYGYGGYGYGGYGAGPYVYSGGYGSEYANYGLAPAFGTGGYTTAGYAAPYARATVNAAPLAAPSTQFNQPANLSGAIPATATQESASDIRTAQATSTASTSGPSAAVSSPSDLSSDPTLTTTGTSNAGVGGSINSIRGGTEGNADAPVLGRTDSSGDATRAAPPVQQGTR